MKFLINKYKRKKYLENLKKNNPKQYELEIKYSPERLKRKFNFKTWFKSNLPILDFIVAIIALVVAILK